MGDTISVTGTAKVIITWPELASALCGTLAYVGVLASEITDEQLAHLEGVIADARKRLAEKNGG